MSAFDFGFARRLPRLFDALGFDASGSQVVGRIARGGDSKALEYALPVATMRSTLIERGHATVEAIDEYLASLADPEFWFVANNVVAAWGRRPE
jgi:hypothetical protein